MCSGHLDDGTVRKICVLILGMIELSRRGGGVEGCGHDDNGTVRLW